MNLRNTLLWLAAALGLLAVILLVERNRPPADETVPGAFPKIDPAKVGVLRVRPGDSLEIRVVRTNGGWRLIQPLDWLAQDTAIEQFLSGIQKLVPVAYITPAELRQRPTADHEYGFDHPRASIMLDFPDGGIHLLVGAMTAPGDQFFLQVVGDEGVYILGAEFLKVIPATMNDWRDRAVVDLNKQRFDLINITNGGKVFALERKTDGPWRLISPIKARADQTLLHEALEKTHSLRTQDFVTDDSDEDLEPYGLEPALLSVALASDTNKMLLQFGKLYSSNLVFARRGEWHTVVTVQKEFVIDWRKPLNDFRERILLSSSQPVGSITFMGTEPFMLAWRTNDWHLSPSNWPGDPDLAKEFITSLNSIPIEQFVNDVTTAPDLPSYGLDAPIRKYAIRFDSPESTNTALELQFGATADGRTFARRTDEDSVYAVPAARVQALPTAQWQLRLRRPFDFTVEEINRVIVSDSGKTRELLRKGDRSWALAPGSQGIINDLAIDETMRGVSAGGVDRWSALGAQHQAEFGITETSPRLTVELKDGRRFEAIFGKSTSSNGLYVAVTLHGMTWIGEYPWILSRDIAAHLAPPQDEGGK